MLRLKGFRFYGYGPLTIVEALVAFSSIIAGAYIASPLIIYSTSMNGASALVTILAGPIPLIIYGTIYTIAGIAGIYGIYRHSYRIRSAALLTQIGAKIFGVFGVFLIQGFLPLTWLSAVTMIFIAIVCYIVVRGFIHRGLK